MEKKNNKLIHKNNFFFQETQMHAEETCACVHRYVHRGYEKHELVTGEAYSRIRHSTYTGILITALASTLLFLHTALAACAFRGTPSTRNSIKSLFMRKSEVLTYLMQRIERNPKSSQISFKKLN